MQNGQTMTMDPAMAIEVAAMSQQRALEEAIERGDSEIQRFYCNTTVLLTGGSGFMGKQLIEKLFRSCQLSKVYLLIRPKKGKTTQERMAEMLKDPVFDQVKKKQPDFTEKLIPVEGDVAEIQLGISNEDWETIIDEVDVIYHMAATTRFDETLRLATMINVRGTREVMILAKACRKLKSFVHVSTAYTQALPWLIDREVYEEFKPSPIPPESLVSSAASSDDSELNAITAKLVAGWPNTYTFTKAVAEEFVRSMSDGLPICIVRPGIVIGSYREPSPGWTDVSNAYGASGIILGVGLGIVHITINNCYSKLGFIPCDYVNNVIISAGREASHSTGGDSTQIYSVTSVAQNPLANGDIAPVLLNNTIDIISPQTMGYIYWIETSNAMLFTFLTWFLHLVPAYIVDFACLLVGKKRRFVKMYEKVYKLSKSLSFFTLNTWLFDDKNTKNLYKGLSRTDKTIFNFDIAAVDWNEYIKIWAIGIRKYILKDGLKGTLQASKKQRLYKFIHYTLAALYLFCIWKAFCGVYFFITYLF